MDVGEKQGWVELGENSWSQWKVGKGDFYRLLPAKVRERKRAVKGAELFQTDKSESASCSQGEEVGFGDRSQRTETEQ